MKKSELIEELVHAGIDDREWLINRINELQRRGWEDQSGAKIHNIKGFLWRAWTSYRNSPWRDLRRLEERIFDLSQRIDAIRANPDHYQRDRSARWKHEETHTPEYRAFVLAQTPYLTEQHTERMKAVLAEADRLLEEPLLDRIGQLASGAEGEDVSYTRDDLIFSQMRLEFSPTELPTFWDWARTHAPFHEKGRLYPRLQAELDECFAELKQLREEKDALRQQAEGKSVVSNL